MSVAQLAQGSVPASAKRAARKDWLYFSALGVFGAVALGAILGPWIAPYDPMQLYVGPENGAPSAANVFGTDDLGRDIFSRMLEGARASVFAPIFVVALSTAGGALLAVAMFGKGLVAPVVALSIAYIPVVARLTQTAASRELGKPYIAALRVQGVSSLAICFRHLVPALVPVVAAQMAVGFGYAMLDLAAISFLGLGQQPPAADWGSMIASGQAGILAGAPEQSLFPAVFVVLAVLSVSIIGARVTTWAEEKER